MIVNKLKETPYLVDISSSEIRDNLDTEKDIFLIEHKDGRRAHFISANFKEGEAPFIKKTAQVLKPRQ